jgi:hypothetical protein
MSVLASLGFGPDSLLMNEPKLFTNTHFLAALVVELEEELGRAGARAALCQIGLIHGLRDAFRTLQQSFIPELAPAAPLPGYPPLAIHFEARRSQTSVEIAGSWPECYEAEARLSKFDSSPDVSCSLSAGYTSGWLSGILDADVLVVEQQCVARGDPRCEFLALETEAWHERSHAEALELLAAISFSAAREAALVAEQTATAHASRDRVTAAPVCDPPGSHTLGSFNPFDPAVHIWGPVMILPCADLDQALQTIDMLAYDASAFDVRVVVLDLHATILDDGFAAATLEQIVDRIEGWGAEAIVTNVAPLSEEIVSDIEVSRLLIRKQLPEAIATAFQISEVQKHLL